MRKILVLLLFLVIHTNVSQACYTDVEAEAEQALRIHSELMVIGLTCLKQPSGVDTYNKYKTFTSKNEKLISDYEAVLFDYFEEQGSDNPERDINDLRSYLANDISNYSVTMGMQTFCDMFSDRLDKVQNMTTYQLKRWAKQAVNENPSTEPKCAFR